MLVELRAGEPFARVSLEWQNRVVDHRLRFHVPLALATQTTLAKGEGMASVDIKVNFLRPVAGDGSTLEARAKVVHRGRSLTVGTAEVLGADGRPVARAALLGT